MAVPYLALALLAASAVAVVGAGSETGEAEEVRYGRDVRPILSDRCFQCHGAEPEQRKAKLRLDLEGSAAIVPGAPEASELFRRISTNDPDDAMPPPHAKKRPLTDVERDTLRRWIESGAEYEPHWAFAAPERPPLPEVRDGDWPIGPIDRFVLARMERAGVAPSPDADLVTLVRRVYLDVTGLPPTVEELEGLVREAHTSGDDNDVLGTLIERLLTEEPHLTRHAEHFASAWLDAARYADTIGIHTDNGRQMWLWRDWVLEALRDGMPYDRFATEQLAGDLLPDATLDQRVASGFNRNHVITDEGGAIDEEYLLEYAADRVNTTSTVFLGLTAGCARCHDHKFDPFSQQDYYDLLAFFNSNDEPGLYSQNPDPQRAFEPFLEVPSAEQSERIDELEQELAELTMALEQPQPGEDREREDFERALAARTELDWDVAPVRSAASTDARVTLTIEPDGAVQASGPAPATEDYELVLSVERPDQRLLLIEALATPGAGPGAGRAAHGNSVLTGVRVETASAPLELLWAWADHTQRNRDYEAANVIAAGDQLGWAHDGNDLAGERDLLLLLETAPPAGSELRLTLEFRSPFPEHSIGRVRVRSSALADSGPLPVALGRWYRLGPFFEESREGLYEREHGPERAMTLELEAVFGPEQAGWAFEGEAVDGEVFSLPAGVGISYLARTLWSPDRRTVEASLGSDDGIQVHLNGELVFEHRVDRGAGPDQDATALELRPGPNLLVLEVVNTGGAAGAFFELAEVGGVLDGELASALLPPDAVPPEQAEDFNTTWRRRYSPSYRALDDQRLAREADLSEARAAVPRAMVMKELAEPRPAFVMLRGQYDLPDAERPAPRSPPAFLPPLPPGAPADRLGLAQWLAAPEHPLFARVAVNRLWQQLFGQGLVRTPDDFGLQGEWPTHPELLDWLAVELRESGWDLRGLLRQMLLSRTYQQASAVRPELAERDPDGRLLAAYPRRRLSAEQIRDHALHVSGLLVERTGGPSVKPYQPEGLWREVSMLASNTRDFTLGEGDELWRRSLYTYWKRAVPPPALQTLDAPTRESCVVRRQSTNTPLQALVLWNDVQFAEAARALAARALEAAEGDDARIEWLLLSCATRYPPPEELALFREALNGFRRRFSQDPEAAEELLSVGMAPRFEAHQPAELAAWTLLASAALNLHETLTQD